MVAVGLGEPFPCASDEGDTQAFPSAAHRCMTAILDTGQVTGDQTGYPVPVLSSTINFDQQDYVHFASTHNAIT